MKARSVDYTIRPLDPSTWEAFAELVERNGGVFGGCWCMAFHPEVSHTDPTLNRSNKRRRVQEGTTHAALVFDQNGAAQGWCQYGIARAALEGALDQIASLGGGLVEAISEVTRDREAHGRFLFSATVELLEQYGFTRGRQVGKHAFIMSRTLKR